MDPVSPDKHVGTLGGAVAELQLHTVRPVVDLVDLGAEPDVGVVGDEVEERRLQIGPPQEDEPAQRPARSTTRTSTPRRCSQCVSARPATPAPETMTRM